MPALYPDVAAIHVHEADRFGNCRIRGTSVADFDLARAAKRLIITCERLIPNDEIRRDPTRTVIPFYCVDAVCEVPFGSYPGNMPYEYFSDEEHIAAVDGCRRRPGVHRRILAEAFFGVKDFTEYLQLAAAWRGCRSCGGRNFCCTAAGDARWPKRLYNAMELMICCAARLLEDGRTVAVGTGVPCAAAMLAQRTLGAELVDLLRGRRRRTAAADHADQRRRLAHLLSRRRWPPAWPTSWRPASAA